MMVMLFIFVLPLIGGGSTGATLSQAESIAESHIRGNVPDDKDFNSILKHDLEKYFSDPGRPRSVEVELLRIGPTQAGVALPKFYIWVKVYEKEKLFEEGAARIAAVEKTHFDVVQYFSKDRIRQEPDLISKVFPAAVYDKIKQKVASQP